jgi:hypothetical protein
MSGSNNMADVARRRHTRGHPPHLRLLSVFAAIGLIASNGLASPIIDEARTTKIKAACVYHLTHMLTWPESQASKEASLLRVAFVGADSHGLAASLRELLNRRPTHLKNIELFEFEQGRDAVPPTATTLSGFHLVFFLGDSAVENHAVLQTLAATGVVTVGEDNLFLYTGGAIAFVVKRKRLRIYVDRQRLESTGVTAGAEFLQHVVFVNRQDRSGHP